MDAVGRVQKPNARKHFISGCLLKSRHLLSLIIDNQGIKALRSLPDNLAPLCEAE
jgi:hypothetical protein